MSLYSKYRPQNFANLVGQEHIRQTILNEIAENKLTHAYLFAGPRGTGKTSTARLIAKSINCTARLETGEPCDECEMCKLIRDGGLIDVLEIDAASNRGIDEIRDLKEKIGYAPSRAKTKIYIIDEIHMLTKEAFNALLKTLEEPPPNTYFILCTTELHKIPETIVSRCQKFDFKRIDVRTLMTRLSYIAQMEGIVVSDEAIELIARHVEGGMRDAIGLFEQLSISKNLTVEYVRAHMGLTGHTTVTALIDLLAEKQLSKALHVINEVHGEGYDLNSFIREMLECLRERLLASIAKENGESARWMEMIEIIEAARDIQRTAVIPQLPLEIAAIKICGGSVASQSVSPEPAKEKETVAEKKQEEARSREEVQTAQHLKSEFEMERFRSSGPIGEHWMRVVEHIQPASLKRSLEQCTVAEDENTLELVFAAQFHFEKVNTAENRIKIEQAITHIFGRQLPISCTLKPAAPSVNAAAQTAPAKKTAKKASSATDPASDLAAKAMEIFGEE